MDCLREQADLTSINTLSQIVIGTVRGKDHRFTNIEPRLFCRDLLWATSCAERSGTWTDTGYGHSVQAAHRVVEMQAHQEILLILVYGNWNPRCLLEERHLT